jgi:hypothetical protein
LIVEQRSEVVLERYFVSTLRLLFEHADLLYETAVFSWDPERGAVSSEDPIWLERWSDPRDAEQGHSRVCESLRRDALTL